MVRPKRCQGRGPPFATDRGAAELDLILAVVRQEAMTFNAFERESGLKERGIAVCHRHALCGFFKPRKTSRAKKDNARRRTAPQRAVERGAGGMV